MVRLKPCTPYFLSSVIVRNKIGSYAGLFLTAYDSIYEEKRRKRPLISVHVPCFRTTKPIFMPFTSVIQLFGLIFLSISIVPSAGAQRMETNNVSYRSSYFFPFEVQADQDIRSLGMDYVSLSFENSRTRLLNESDQKFQKTVTVPKAMLSGWNFFNNSPSLVSIGLEYKKEWFRSTENYLLHLRADWGGQYAVYPSNRNRGLYKPVSGMFLYLKQLKHHFRLIGGFGYSGQLRKIIGSIGFQYGRDNHYFVQAIWPFRVLLSTPLTYPIRVQTGVQTIGLRVPADRYEHLLTLGPFLRIQSTMGESFNGYFLLEATWIGYHQLYRYDEPIIAIFNNHPSNFQYDANWMIRMGARYNFKVIETESTIPHFDIIEGLF